MIRTQMGNAQVFIHAHNRSVIVSALGTFFAKPPCNSNSRRNFCTSTRSLVLHSQNTANGKLY
jgi:hypothetical protein